MKPNYWVDEAIASLGYLKPEVEPALSKLIHENASLHPRQIATAYRKAGEQLSREEKKALGIRANAVMSRQALDDLTEKGLTAPLAAHETTILRAVLASKRAKQISEDRSQGVTRWKFITPFPEQCDGCKRLDEKSASADEIQPTGPHDCFREACAITLRADITSLDAMQSRQTPPGKPRRRWWPW